MFRIHRAPSLARSVPETIQPRFCSHKLTPLREIAHARGYYARATRSGCNFLAHIVPLPLQTQARRQTVDAMVAAKARATMNEFVTTYELSENHVTFPRQFNTCQRRGGAVRLATRECPLRSRHEYRSGENRDPEIYK
jgi:hypothetical protein